LLKGVRGIEELFAEKGIKDGVYLLGASRANGVE
jgi:hypothetical protein